MSLKVENIELALREHFNTKIVSNGFWSTYAQIVSEFNDQFVTKLDNIGYAFDSKNFSAKAQIDTAPTAYGGNAYFYATPGDQTMWKSQCNAKFYAGKEAYTAPAYTTSFNPMGGTTGSGNERAINPVDSNYFTVVPIVVKVSELPDYIPWYRGKNVLLPKTNLNKITVYEQGAAITGFLETENLGVFDNLEFLQNRYVIIGFKFYQGTTLKYTVQYNTDIHRTYAYFPFSGVRFNCSYAKYDNQESVAYEPNTVIVNAYGLLLGALGGLSIYDRWATLGMECIFFSAGMSTPHHFPCDVTYHLVSNAVNLPTDFTYITNNSGWWRDTNNNDYYCTKLLTFGSLDDIEIALNSTYFQWAWSVDDIQNGNIHDTTGGQQGNQTTDGIGGNGDNHTDDINTIINAPTYTPSATGFTNHWILTGAQLPELGTFLFSETFLNDLKRLVTNPLDSVLAVRYYPYNVVNVAATEAKDVYIGNVNSRIAAYRMLPQSNNRVPLGVIDVNNYYGDFADYNGYTRTYIYLPYIGFNSLDTNKIMGQTLNIYYVLDYMSGACTAQIITANGDYIAEYTGKIGIDIAFSGTQQNILAQQILSSMATLATTAIGAAASPAVGGAAAVSGLANITTGLFNAAQEANTPVTIGKSSNETWLYAPQKPFLVFSIPRELVADGYKDIVGYPTAYGGTLGTYRGFVKCSDFHFNAPNDCTEQEIAEIETLLKQGVIV